MKILSFDQQRLRTRNAALNFAKAHHIDDPYAIRVLALELHNFFLDGKAQGVEIAFAKMKKARIRRGEK